MTFKLLRETEYPNKKIKVSIFEHKKTKAQHIHTQYDTEENSFSVAFRTLPKNSKGIPHILEHSVLCGSKKFPSKNLFFNMRGRNFDTFMNASTGFETTQYPFSSIDRQGFFNLMEVYTDVVFFPMLEKETFFQEGWRYEIKEDNNQKKLQYTGVVYNEMIGAYSNPSRVSYVEMLKSVYKGSQYENFSGGHPLDITDLSYDEFLDFHKKYYHPSNAIFYTFGSISCKEIHEKLEGWVLSKFDYLEVDKTISMEHTKEKQFTGEHPGEKGVTLNIGWKIDKFNKCEDYYEVQLLCRLLSSGKNNIRDKIIQFGSCEGFDIVPINKPAIMLSIDTEQEHVNSVKVIIDTFLKDIINNGIESKEFDNMFDMIEMSQRKEGEDGFGRNINNRYVMLNKYDIKDVENIHNMVMYKRVRKNLSNPEYLRNKINEMIINNNNTFEYLSVANPLYSQQLQEKIDNKINEKSMEFNANDIEKINKLNEHLIKRRNEPENIEILPKITLKNIELPKEKNKKLQNEVIDGVNITSYQEETNNLVRFEIFFPLNVVSKEDFYLQYLTLNLMSNLAFKGMTLEESNFFRESKTTDISGMLEIFEDKVYWKFGLLALAENAQYIMKKIKKVLTEIDFSNEEKIKSNISSYVRDFLNGYQESAHYYALFETRGKVTSSYNYEQLVNLNYYTEFLSAIEKDSFYFAEIIKKLPEKYRSVFSKQPDVFIIALPNEYNTITKEIHLLKSYQEEFKNLKSDALDSNIFFDLNIPTNHVAVSYKVAQLNEKDGPALKVFEGMIKDYLIKNIRQKNGAYGANADYSHNGVLTFYSYRDSQIEKTIELIINLKNSKEDIAFTQEQLEVSKLNIIKTLKKPRSNMSQGIMEFNRYMKGHYISHDILTQQILQVSIEDVNNILRKLIDPKIAVSSSLEKYKQADGWEVISPLNEFKKGNEKKLSMK